jgi:HEAT repeat protein
LDAGDEVDRTAVLTALAGVMARAPSEGAVQRLVHALDLAAGPERDALLLAIGRATLASAMRELTTVARAPEVDDRRTVATVLAAHAAQPTTRADALQLAKAMMSDADASVRAQAAWALGAFGEVSALPVLTRALRGPDVDTAVNAAGAIGRATAKARRADLAVPALCPLLADARPYVRANALAGIALVSGRCGDGSMVRKVLAEDANDVVRAAAALALGRAAGPARDEDQRALERCAASDRAGVVARRCRAVAPAPRGLHAVEIYVVSDGSATPRPRTAYALALSDGTLRVGTSDRRGALFEPAAPEGDVSLERPSALSHP